LFYQPRWITLSVQPEPDNPMTDIPILDDAGAQPQLHNREAEEAVLGSVLIHTEAYYDVAQFLQADDFYIIRNRWIWEVFQQLTERRTPIDYFMVCEELDNRRQLEEIGGRAYVTSLINQTPTALHAEAYGRLVQEASIRRRMLGAANNLAKLAYNQQQSIDTIIGEAEKSIFGLSERRSTSGPTPIKAVASEYYDRVDLLSQRTDEIYGVPTGLYRLDELLNGLQKSDLLIIAGRPGMGKTGFMLSIAKNAALKHKKHVAMFSLEMANEQLVQRLISQETGIDTQRLRTGKLQGNEWGIFTQAIEVLSDAPIWLDDTPAITPLQLRTKCRRLHMEYQLDLVIVDYLQLMSGDLRTDNRVQEVSYISRNLKVLARELNVPVLAAAQLSRAVEQRADKRPQLSDLRESGSLEQDADIVMFINRPDAMEKESPLKNMAELIVAKHRNGPTGSVELVFLNNLARFENAALPNQQQRR
jgi:replicative DNA helicase